jgi:hypothetical protein
VHRTVVKARKYTLNLKLFCSAQYLEFKPQKGNWKIRKKIGSRNRALISNKRGADCRLTKVVSRWPTASRRRSFTVIGIIVDSLNINCKKGQKLLALNYEIAYCSVWYWRQCLCVVLTLQRVAACFRHNDLPWNLRKLNHNYLKNFSFEELKNDSVWNCSSCFTDLKRLKAGRVGAQVTNCYEFFTNSTNLSTNRDNCVLPSICHFFLHLRNCWKVFGEIHCWTSTLECV